MSRTYYIYILGSKSLVLYIGSTSELKARIYQHRTGQVDGFTKKYNVTKLLYFEIYTDPENMVKRERQLKNWHREWKINLIKTMNPSLKDLYYEILK